MRKIHATAIAMLLCMAGSAAAQAQGKPVIAVASFTNQTSTAAWWNGDVGRQLADVLSNELSSSGDFTVVERAQLGAVMAEQNLAADGLTRPGSGPRQGNITGARYLVTGIVTAYTEDTSETGGGLSFRGVSLGGKRSEAYVAIDLRVIDSETSEVAFSRTVEGRTSSSGVNVGGWFRNGLGGTFNHKKNTPAGKAVRAALIEAVNYLDCAMVRRDGCMGRFDQKEQRRRQSSQDVLDLD
jgi:curli biogenesis system outer membrane secretion channel CsgG